MAEKNYAFVDAHEYRDLVEDSCMNYRRGQVLSLIGDTIKRNLDPDRTSVRSLYSKYGRVCKDSDTVIDCILTILEIVEPWAFRQIMNSRQDEDEDIILPDSAEVGEDD